MNSREIAAIRSSGATDLAIARLPTLAEESGLDE